MLCVVQKHEKKDGLSIKNLNLWFAVDADKTAASPLKY